MISVIICSINKDFARQVQQNIAETIGVEWEPVVIDNTVAPKSITAVYNEGAKRARFNILCFAHEDILFKTNDWGRTLVNLFESDQQLGLVAVAGCKFKSKVPSGWFTGVAAADCCNIRHFNKHGITETLYFNPEPTTNQQQVVVADGVFLCCPKQVWEQTLFDEKLLDGFHLYDLDFSFRVSQQFTAIVTYNIDILHITKGDHFDNKWLDYTLRWHRNMAPLLPVASGDFKGEPKELEDRVVKTWLIRLKHEKLSVINKLGWLKAIKVWMHPGAWPNVPLFLVKSFLPESKAPATGR